MWIRSSVPTSITPWVGYPTSRPADGPASSVAKVSRNASLILPERILTEPLTDGPAAGARLDRERLARMVRAYNRERGWSDDGHPPLETRGDLLLDA